MKVFFAFLLALTLLLSSSALLLAEEAKTFSAGDLSYIVQPAWEEQKVSSPMRQAQFRVPKLQESEEDGELAVFYFGAEQGGTVEANINRWTSQFSSAVGKEAQGAKPEVTEMKVNDLGVTLVFLKGDYTGAMTAASAAVSPKKDFAMRCAIVKGPKGPVFFRMTGPRQTVEQASATFDEMVKTVKAVS